jgi:signal transduction histidine kinase
MSVLASDLVRAEAEARASSRAKSEFLAVMSHEIRTPLNGVLGVAALMERKLTQEGMRPYVQTNLDSGQSLLRLLTDALDMSRAEAGLMTFETAPINLDSVATDLKALWSPRAEEKDLVLTVTRDTIGRDWVAGDEVRLKQLFNNLIGNALKFTEAGEVAVHIASREMDGQIALTATVDDSGPGIPDDLAGTISPRSTPAGRAARARGPASAWPSAARSWNG